MIRPTPLLQKLTEREINSVSKVITQLINDRGGIMARQQFSGVY